MSDEIVARQRRAGRLDAEADVQDATGEIRKLTSLVEISQALSASLKLAESLPAVLDTLERHHSVVRASVTLTDEENSERYVAASSGGGPSSERTRAGEGMVARVIETGRAVVVPQVSQEPLLHERGRRADARELSFICVPLAVNRRTVGALAVHLAFKRHRQYQRSLKFFRVVGSMIAQAVKVARVAETERRRLVEENTHLRDELRDRYAFRHIIGNSAPIQSVYEQVAQVARTNTTVLIRGESGTGKEMIAHAIHYNSPRAKKPFIKVSCAALPGSLIESELFGYEKGAFTGAHGAQEGPLRAGGGRHAVPRRDRRRGRHDAGEAAARAPGTRNRAPGRNAEHPHERAAGRGDPSAARGGDGGGHVPRGSLLPAERVHHLRAAAAGAEARHHAAGRPLPREVLAVEHGKHIKRIATPAIDMLTSYHWPGNVRELENTIERAVLVCDGSVIHGHHLPPTLQTAEASGTMPRTSLEDTVAAFETRSDPGRAQVDPRQPRACGPAAADDRAHPRTTRCGSTDRLRPVRRVTARARAGARLESGPTPSLTLSADRRSGEPPSEAARSGASPLAPVAVPDRDTFVALLTQSNNFVRSLRRVQRCRCAPAAIWRTFADVRPVAPRHSNCYSGRESKTT